jgi:hypothetical protein
MTELRRFEIPSILGASLRDADGAPPKMTARLFWYRVPTLKPVLLTGKQIPRCGRDHRQFDLGIGTAA